MVTNSWDDHETAGMEMPCRCDCGSWFDLHEGMPGDRNKVICPECYELLCDQESEELDRMAQELCEEQAAEEADEDWPDEDIDII